MFYEKGLIYNITHQNVPLKMFYNDGKLIHIELTYPSDKRAASVNKYNMFLKKNKTNKHLLMYKKWPKVPFCEDIWHTKKWWYVSDISVKYYKNNNELLLTVVLKTIIL